MRVRQEAAQTAPRRHARLAVQPHAPRRVGDDEAPPPWLGLAVGFGFGLGLGVGSGLGLGLGLGLGFGLLTLTLSVCRVACATLSACSVPKHGTWLGFGLEFG